MDNIWKAEAVQIVLLDTIVMGQVTLHAQPERIHLQAQLAVPHVPQRPIQMVQARRLVQNVQRIIGVMGQQGIHARVALRAVQEVQRAKSVVVMAIVPVVNIAVVMDIHVLVIHFAGLHGILLLRAAHLRIRQWYVTHIHTHQVQHIAADINM